MAVYILTTENMNALGNYVFAENGHSASDPVASTGHNWNAWIKEVNEALIGVSASGFGKDYSRRQITPPFPPMNLNGEMPPPGPPPSATLGKVSDAFVGFQIEV
ncbi:MAG: hypothetical protein HRF49_05530 [bacterium]|jgi:hypothetical protein